MRVALLSVVFAAGCLESNLVPCGDLLCGVDQQCTESGCVDRDRVAACKESVEGDACDVSGVAGVCRDGACATQVCGDGVIDEPEECEGEDLGGATCLTFGFYEPGGLACDACQLDTSACAGTCGDGAVNGPELCDTTPGEALTCSEVGFDYGSVTCSPALCAPLYAGCANFGWRERAHTVDTPNWITTSRPGDVYVGANNLVMHFELGASTRIDVDRDMCGDADRGWASPTDELFVATDRGVCRYTAAGWSLDAIGRMRATWGTSSTDVYAVGATLQHFDGTAWSTVVTGLPAGAYRDVIGRGSTVVATRDRSVAIAIGGVWQLEMLDTSGTLSRPWIAPSGDVFILAGQQLHRRTNGAWTAVATPGEMDHVWGIGDRAIYVANEQSLWAYDLTSWMRVELPDAVVGWSALGGSDSHLVFTQPYQRFYESSGYLWSEIDPAVSMFAAVSPEVWAFDPDHVMLLEGQRALYLDGNVTRTFDLGRNLRDAWGIGSTLFVATSDRLLVFDGTTWSLKALNGCDVDAVWGEAIDRVFLVGNTTCMWNGTTVVMLSPNQGGDDVWGSAATGSYIINHGSIRHLPPNAAPMAWVSEALPAIGAIAIWGDATELVVTFDDRQIYRRAHGSTTWTQVLHELALPISELTGTTGDLFGISRSTNGSDSQIVRWDGVTWDPVAGPPHMPAAPTEVFSSSAGTWMAGENALVRMFRPR